jgi:HEAT repeat protein
MFDDRRVSKLITELGDPDRLVRSSAIWLLIDAGVAARTALPTLKKLLDDESESFVRLGAAAAICRIAPNDSEEALPVLLAELHDNKFEYRDAACRFIGELGQKAEAAIPTLLNLLDDESETVRCSASEAIGRISGDWTDAIEIGIRLLQDSDCLLRVVAAKHFAMIGIGAKPAIPRLQRLLGYVDWDVRLDVEVVLADIQALRLRQDVAR